MYSSVTAEFEYCELTYLSRDELGWNKIILYEGVMHSSEWREQNKKIPSKILSYDANTYLLIQNLHQPYLFIPKGV